MGGKIVAMADSRNVQEPAAQLEEMASGTGQSCAPGKCAWRLGHSSLAEGA